MWEMLDRDHLTEVARKGPEPIFATISGAHLYGFASPDSDVVLRGAFMLEALKACELRVRRDDAEQLSAIRDGALSFDDLLVVAGDLQQSMQKASTATELPHDVDYDRVDALLTTVRAWT